MFLVHYYITLFGVVLYQYFSSVVFHGIIFIIDILMNYFIVGGVLSAVIVVYGSCQRI